MHYSPRDPFRLANRIAAHLEIPGAAEVRLRDLVYGIEGESYRYFFTLEYTIGAVHAQSGIQCVATFIEARHGREHSASERPVICDTGESLPLVDRYAQLKSRAADRDQKMRATEMSPSPS